MHIALVDPSRTNRLIVGNLLKARGHEVLFFEDAAPALARLESDLAVEALITSAELPSTNGLELCWNARLLTSARRFLYILMMSSITDNGVIAEALDSGADDFIGKPPRPEELYARLRNAQRLNALQRELVHLATTDGLTGVYNRRGFFEHAEAACENPGRALSVILIDVDFFKDVNDLYSHATGDDALRAIAREAQMENAVVGRLGGDEFAVLLKGYELSKSTDFAEELRRKFAKLKFATPQGSAKLTCSLGVAQLQRGDTVDALINRADHALYRAKEEGRNRVAEPPSQEWIAEHPRNPDSIARTQARSAESTRSGCQGYRSY
jgi:diguanylate cyclase (GGDEF)-like protein